MPTATAGTATRRAPAQRTGRIRIGQCESCRRHDMALFELAVDDVDVMPFEVCAICE